MLLLGLIASPQPKVPGDEYSERSFWSVVDRLSGCSGQEPYAARREAAERMGLAAWDVLADVHEAKGRAGRSGAGCAAGLWGEATPRVGLAR